jgi:hypothetical protein
VGTIPERERLKYVDIDGRVNLQHTVLNYTDIPGRLEIDCKVQVRSRYTNAYGMCGKRPTDLSFAILPLLHTNMLSETLIKLRERRP